MSSMPDESSPTSKVPNGNGEVDAEAATAAYLNGTDDPDPTAKVLEYLKEARAEGGEALVNGSAFKNFKEVPESDAGGSVDDAPAGGANGLAASPAGSYSTPDDTPSLHGSVASSFAGSNFGRAYSPAQSLRPFDRRFSSRLHSSPGLSPSPRASPSLSALNVGNHSRVSSFGSKFDNMTDIAELDGAPTPWEVVRWNKIKKVSNQIFSEDGRRKFGAPTCLSPSGSIAVGTSKGVILVFDYNQSLKSIIGPGTKAIECGAITSLAVSADYSTIAGGHSTGHIFTWELSKPGRPFLHIQPIPDRRLNAKGDGHIEGVSVLHLGFLGTRHTALVSGDDKGMAFSHLATRGLGAVGRVVRTTRVLGRYPEDVAPTGRPRKPSAVLGLSVLPLGNAPESTDTMGLTAMLTPYLLVIVSTTPVAQTQYKTARPKEAGSESALSGCLAWYPSVKLKQSNSSARARLAYCWSDALSILELSVSSEANSDDPNRPPELEFRSRGHYRCDEAIVAVQWLARRVVSILTVSQRNIILELEDKSLRVSETFDLLPRHILHTNPFSEQLHSLVDRMDDEGSLHPHVADAYYNSFRAYKGRMFLLCSYEISVGTLSNWSDRLISLMEHGDYIGAIRLATAYYVGDGNKLTLGLPDDPKQRHPLVAEKLEGMMSASLKYAFGQNQISSRNEPVEKRDLQDLASACFDASLAMERPEFLFDEAFEFFEETEHQGIFLETLEPHIIDEHITSIPPTVVKAIITHYTALELDSRLEELICHMDTRTLDIDQVTSLCKQHNLYDAMIYVWNRALDDYITPLIELLSLITPQQDDSIHAVNALKLFPYLSYTLTGRIYPTGDELADDAADTAKAQIYYFLFLGTVISWPKGSGRPFQPGEANSTFPYLRLILQYDAPSLLSALNEAFEDAFLNGVHGDEGSDSEDQVFGKSFNRQFIVQILLEVLNPDDYPKEYTIYLDMFIARNIPKFPQFILLPGFMLEKVLERLCDPPGGDIADDCQLSVEYLLTVYRPPDIDHVISLFIKAHYYRVLASIFRAEKQYARLLKTYFEDVETEEVVFECIGDCLRPRSSLNDKQRREVRDVIAENATNLLRIDGLRAARVIDAYAPELHKTMLTAAAQQAHQEFLYLGAILEQGGEKDRPATSGNKEFVERYVTLMCEFEPDHVSDYISHLQQGDLRLEEVLPAMEDGGVMDAVVVLLAREGQVRQAMDRLISHLGTLEMALGSVIKASREDGVDVERSNAAAGDTLESLQKYSKIGIWLAQGQMAMHRKRPKTQLKQRRRADDDPLSTEEQLWLDLISGVVRIAINTISLLQEYLAASAAPNGTPASPASDAPTLDAHTFILSLRTFVQTAFTALLTSTSNTTNTTTSTSFLHILRNFLTQAARSSPSLADLRSVLTTIFEAYLYESQLLRLANSLLDKDLFVHVDDAAKQRYRGWRTGSPACGVCGLRVWGPGAAGGIYAAWERRRIKMKKAETTEVEMVDEYGRRRSEVSRGKMTAGREEREEASKEDGDGDAVVVFNCRHVFHRRCVEREGAEALECMACTEGRP